MNIMIEGWEPTPLEQSIIDGSFDRIIDRIIAENAVPDIPEDLLDVQPFEDAMNDLRNEIKGLNEM